MDQSNGADQLSTNGIHFEVGRRWTAKFSKKKTRRFIIQSPPIGVLVRLTNEYLKLSLDEELLENDGQLEAKRLVCRHGWLCSKILATTVINNNIYYPFQIWVLTAYFYMRVDSRTLLNLTLIINRIAGYGDFIQSVRYLSCARTTRPLSADVSIDE